MPDFTGLTLLFAGSGAFGVPTLGRLIDRGATVTRVFTQPSKPAGRGNKLTPTPIGQFALERGLPLAETADINAEPLPPADLLVVIAFGQKLAPPIIEHARLGAINLHASRLPRYRGAAPINWAVIEGDPTTGNSVIRLAQRMDAGAVLAMSELPIGELDTAGELHDRLAIDGSDLVERVAADLRAGTASPVEQDHALATRAPKLSRDAAQIDWRRDARSIANQIRGMHPWPGCRVRVVDEAGKELDRLTLIRARPTGGIAAFELSPDALTDSGTCIDGSIIHDGTVVCGLPAGHAEHLSIVELQPDGKRPMSLAAYRNGKRWEPGLRLESIR